MTEAQARFGQLRSLLMGKQSSYQWNKICRLLDQWDEDDYFLDVVLPYAVDYLKDWPDTIRLAPQRWVKLAVQGEPTYRMQIATQLSCSSNNYNDAKLATLFSQPAVASISNVDLYCNYGSSQFVDALLHSDYTSQIKILGLGHNRLNPEELIRLVQSDWFSQVESFSLADMRYKVTYELDYLKDYLHAFDAPSCTNLRALNLSWSYVEADEFIRFVQSEHLTSLTSLDMYNFYSQRGSWSDVLRQLKDTPMFERLKWFDFKSYTLTVEDYEVLLQYKFNDEILTQLDAYREAYALEEEQYYDEGDYEDDYE